MCLKLACFHSGVNGQTLALALCLSVCVCVCVCVCPVIVRESVFMACQWWIWIRITSVCLPVLL